MWILGSCFHLTFFFSINPYKYSTWKYFIQWLFLFCNSKRFLRANHCALCCLCGDDQDAILSTESSEAFRNKRVHRSFQFHDTFLLKTWSRHTWCMIWLTKKTSKLRQWWGCGVASWPWEEPCSAACAAGHPFVDLMLHQRVNPSLQRGPVFSPFPSPQGW